MVCQKLKSTHTRARSIDSFLLFERLLEMRLLEDWLAHSGDFILEPFQKVALWVHWLRCEIPGQVSGIIPRATVCVFLFALACSWPWSCLAKVRSANNKYFETSFTPYLEAFWNGRICCSTFLYLDCTPFERCLIFLKSHALRWGGW